MNGALIEPDGLGTALFLILALAATGVVHVWWLRWATADLLMRPLDFGLTFRGRRVFGDNKRLRGVLLMPVVAALAFAGLGAMRQDLPDLLSLGMWELSGGRYALLGAAAGCAFMLAELPNSFLKRQLGVAPGGSPDRGWARLICPLLDRVDSSLGVLIVVSLLVPTSAAAWAWVLLLGPLLHALFSASLWWLGVKDRAL